MDKGDDSPLKDGMEDVNLDFISEKSSESSSEVEVRKKTYNSANYCSDSEDGKINDENETSNRKTI